MKLTITTLGIVEDIHDPQCDDMSICYHSFKEDPEEAKSELISEVNALYYIGLGLILVLFLNSSGPNLDTFIPGNPWEHYCKYELHKHPFHTNEKEYNYFLDTFTSTDKYEQIVGIYANPR